MESYLISMKSSTNMRTLRDLDLLSYLLTAPRNNCLYFYIISSIRTTMLGSLFFIFCACFSAVYGQTDCSTLPDGHYNIGCKVYDVCTNHVVSTIECTQNQVYNNKTKACDYQNHVDPPCGLVRDCSSKNDGAYTDYGLNCTSYYTCSHKVYYGHNFCTPGTVFEFSLGTCVWPADAYPPCGSKVNGTFAR